LGIRKIQKLKVKIINFKQMKIENTEHQDSTTPPLLIVNVSKRYFHELSQEEVDKLITDKKNWGYIMNEYKQPDWCNCPNALEGTMGCWSLVDLSKDGFRTKISKDFCKGCDKCSL
jgi:hypothetical protein